MTIIKFLLLLLIFSVTSCKSTGNITGSWSVEHSEIPNFSMPPNCKNIPLGALFQFNADSTLTVYANDSVCMQGRYITEGKSVQIITSDVVYTVGIAKAGKDNLVLLQRHLPQQMMTEWKKEYDKYKQEGFRITLRRAK